VRWLDGHRNEVSAAAFSPDGNLAASGGVGGAVRLWNVVSGEMNSLQQAQLDEPVNCVCFSPDGKLLFAIGDNGRARLWRVADGELHGKLKSGVENLCSAAFSRDGSSIMAGSGRRFKVCKWDVETGERLTCFGEFVKRQSSVRKTWVTADGHRLLAMGLKTKSKVKQHIDPTPSTLEIFVPIAWGGRVGLEQSISEMDMGFSRKNYYLELWDFGNERSIEPIDLGEENPPALACSPDGRRVLVAFHDDFVLLFAF
jgi:hypothetical protein